MTGAKQKLSFRGRECVLLNYCRSHNKIFFSLVGPVLSFSKILEAVYPIENPAFRLADALSIYISVMGISVSVNKYSIKS